MNAFDGRFALNYIYPLAVAAYDEPWNSVASSVLAGFTQVAEIRIDTKSPSFQVALAANPSPGAHGLLSSMTKPKGAGSVPAAGLVAAGIPLDDRFGWVCVDPSRGRLIVAFRGTQTATDWINDLEFTSEAYRPIPGGGTVHHGFQHVYYAVRDNLLKLVKERCGSIREVLVTGHSLGAALATLALPDILHFLREQPGVPEDLAVTLYNLASPRVGHTDFKNFFNTRFPCWRVVNFWDVVPNVPPQLAGYAHVGAALSIDSGWSVNFAHNHVLTTGYLPGLTSWNKTHPSKGVVAMASNDGRYVPPGISD